jgi:ubiquitin related modifier 1
MSEIALKIEFGGGLELLFGNTRSHRVSVPAAIPASSTSENGETRPADVNFLIHWLKDYLLKERPELFIEEGTVYVFILFAGVRRLKDIRVDDLVSSSSLMIRTGNSKAKGITSSRMEMRLYSFLRCTAAEECSVKPLNAG